MQEDNLTLKTELIEILGKNEKQTLKNKNFNLSISNYAVSIYDSHHRSTNTR